MKYTFNGVSVCICTYNQAPYLEKAIRSAAVQTLLPVEIIVSDDCSTDETPQILQQLSAEIPFLKVVQQPKNIGIAKNIDACLRMATGDLIIRLDSDDYLFPMYTEKLSELLLKYPSAGYAHAAVQEINERGHFLNERKLFRKSGFQSDRDALKASIKGYRVTANILMFRKEALIKVDYMSGRPNFGEDFHLAAAISAAGFGNVYMNEILAFYRIWTDVGKIRQRRKLIEIKGLRKVFEDVIEPAYKERAWSLKILKSCKTDFACQHADCLGWEIYSAEEKKEIAFELSKLSGALRAKVCSWIYLNGFGAPATLIFNLKSNIKSIIKTMLITFNGLVKGIYV
ncbi:MAG: glycosyl transferase [Mucilaginibacter sp.]|nr:glycosyl transferase [Mucilaginibacter sp.]